MAISKPENKKPETAKPATTAKPETAKPANNGAATTEDAKPKKDKKVRLRFVSKSISGYWVRILESSFKSHGAPRDPKGEEMELKAFAPGGLSKEERETRKAQKEADKALEKQRFDAMSDDEKVAYARKKREEKQAKRNEKKSKERDKLMAEVQAEYEAKLKAAGVKLPEALATPTPAA